MGTPQTRADMNWGGDLPPPNSMYQQSQQPGGAYDRLGGSPTGSLKDGRVKTPYGWDQGQKTGWNGANQPPGVGRGYRQMQNTSPLQQALTVQLDPRNQPRQGRRDPTAYARMLHGLQPRNGPTYGSMNEARGNNPAADWWMMQKQARDNGTWQGYNTGLDEYQQRWGRGGPTSAYGLLQALGAQRRTA